MKKLIKLFGIIALIAIIGFAMAACGGGGGDDPGGQTTGTTTGFSVSGKFNKSASEEVKFTLAQLKPPRKPSAGK